VKGERFRVLRRHGLAPVYGFVARLYHGRDWAVNAANDWRVQEPMSARSVASGQSGADTRQLAMKILVTGATGVIGSRLVPRLVGAGHTVAAAVRSARNAGDLVRTGATPIQVDLFDPSAVRDAMSGQDVVINLATLLPGSSAAVFLPGAWREIDRLRREASANLVDAAIARGVRRFIQESFALVYPDRGDDWIDEATPIAPVRYNRSVADAEASAARFTSAGGIGIVARFAAFYGPDAFQFQDLARVMRYGLALLPGRPDAFISSISHDDAASAVAAMLDAQAGIYNVVDDEPLRRREYFAALAQPLGVKEPRMLPPWTAFLFGSLGEMLARSQRMSNRKLRDATGWEPRHRSVKSGFPAAVEAMRAEGALPRGHAA